MDAPMKMTKQGIRDLNSYGPRAKPVEADATAPAEAEVLPEVVTTAPVKADTPVVADGTDGGAP